ncbi:NUDIX domain-containing protein [Salinispira pacifica]
MKPIRNSAKALILDGDRFLAVRKQSGDRHYYVLPGGGQEREETLAETLRRECLEEINAEVRVKELLFVREYIGKNHEFAQFDSDLHQVEFIFRCEVADADSVCTGVHPDARQVGVQWFPVDGAEATKLYPKVLRRQIGTLRPTEADNGAARPDGSAAPDLPPVYLGDVN